MMATESLCAVYEQYFPDVNAAICSIMVPLAVKKVKAGQIIMMTDDWYVSCEWTGSDLLPKGPGALVSADGLEKLILSKQADPQSRGFIPITQGASKAVERVGLKPVMTGPSIGRSMYTPVMYTTK